MTYIDPFKASQVAEEWHTRLKTYITVHNCQTKWVKKIDDSNELTPKEKELGTKLINDFCDNLDSYSKAMQDGIRLKLNHYKSTIKPHVHLHQTLKPIFINLYSAFTADIIEVNKKPINLAYHILNILDLRTCPYCNRNYTFSVYGKKKRVRPEFDHFYDKATYPILAVSFYNLVPSCPLCNHTKKNDSLHINPYFEEFKGMFKIDKDGHYKGYETKIANETEDMETLGLDALYEKHEDYVQEIFAKAQAYNEHARKALVESFQSANHSPQDVFDFVWGKNLETVRQINRPLSKLTRDVLQQAGVIASNDDKK